MKQNRGLLISIFLCLIFAVAGYSWAAGLATSIINYRSPLRFAPPAPDAPLGTPLTRRVVIVLIDGLRYTTSTNTDVMPFMNTLRGSGAGAHIYSQPPSYSGPGMTTLLTGAWPDINDAPPINLDDSNIRTFTQDDIFSAAHRLGLRTALSGYDWLGKIIPQHALDASFYTSGAGATADQAVMQAALPALSGNYQLVLIYLDQVDYVEYYQGGPLDPPSYAAAKRTDSDLQRIVSTLDLKKDTVIVLSDHGQINRGGDGGPEPITLLEPFVMAGAGVRPSMAIPDITQADVAPTVAALLGTNLPASTEGRVLTEMLNLAPAYAAKIQAAEIIQKKRLFQAYTTAINAQPARPPDPSDSFSYAIAMLDARAARLASERTWRNLAAIALAVLPAYFLVISGKKKFLWLAGGAVVYVLIFNFCYAILENQTYSLSAVESQNGFIIITAVTASIALVIAWLISMLRLRAFQAGPRNAAETSLGFILFTLYLLALPILVNFAVNGILVTWTLPEFYTAYIALLSLIQWVLVAMFGLVLAGAAALVAHYVPHPIRKYRKSRRKHEHQNGN
ncbi:MAG: alkaline phosphatase family protein [Anaerolineales bacterium]